MGNLDFNKIIFNEVTYKIKKYISRASLGEAEIYYLNNNTSMPLLKSDSLTVKIKICREYFPIVLHEKILKLQKRTKFPVEMVLTISNVCKIQTKENMKLICFQLKEYIISQITAVSNSFVADRDMLTGFLNKTSILKHIQSILGAPDKDEKKFKKQYFTAADQNRFEKHFMIMLDIDDFKKFNSLYGYTVGDFVITSVALRVSDFFKLHKQDHYTGRYGGEEFIILFSADSLKEAYEISNEIRLNIRKNAVSDLIKKVSEFPALKLLCNQIKQPITISGGLLELDHHSTDAYPKAENLITKVSAALGVAKKTGKDRVIGFNDIISKFCFVSEVLPCNNQIRINLGAWHGISSGMKFHVMDAAFNGSSAYFDTSGREKTGTRPQRIKALVEVNPITHSPLEVQEKIAFATVLEKSDWPLKAGDSLIPVADTSFSPSLLSFSAISFKDTYNQFQKYSREISSNTTQHKRGSKKAFSVISLNIPTEMGIIGKDNILKGLISIINAARKNPENQTFKIDSFNNSFALSLENFRWSCIKKVCQNFDLFLKNSVNENSFLNALVHIDGNNEPREFLAEDMLCSLIQKRYIEKDFSVDIWDCRHADLAGAFYYKSGDMEKARRLFTEAIEFDSEKWSPHNNLGNYYMSTDNFVAAEKEYKKAVQLSKEAESYPLYNLAYLYLLKNSDSEKSLELLFKANNLGLDDGHINNQIAMALLANNDSPEKALKFSEKAVEITPDLPEFIDTKLMCLLKCRKNSQAVECAETLIRNIDFSRPFNTDLLENIYQAVKNNRPLLSRFADNYEKFDDYLKTRKRIRNQT